MSNCQILKASVNVGGYSKEESIVGTWIDGKPIYRKVLTLTQSLANGASITIPHGISGIETIVSCFGTGYYAGYNYILPWTQGQNNTSINIVTKDGVIIDCRNTTWGDTIWTIILEYTKTTDPKNGGGLND